MRDETSSINPHQSAVDDNTETELRHASKPSSLDQGGNGSARQKTSTKKTRQSFAIKTDFANHLRPMRINAKVYSRPANF